MKHFATFPAIPICTFFFALWLVPKSEGQEYVEPDFNRPLFDRSDFTLSPNEQSILVAVLVELAKQEGLSSSIKANALAFAFTISPGNLEVVEANFALRNGIKFSGFQRPRSKEEVLVELKRLIPEVEEADGTIGARVSALARRLIDQTESPGLAAEQSAMDEDGDNDSIAIGKFPREVASVGGVFLTEVEVNKLTSPIQTRWSWLSKSMKPMTIRANVRELGTSGSSISVVQGQLPPELASAMREMVKMLSLRNVSVPNGNGIEISFGEGYSSGDGPSSVLGCALLVDALLNDIALDPQFAPIGDLNADGTIQPVYYLRERLVAAQSLEEDSGIDLIAVPEKNAARLSDILLTDGVEPIFQTQIFTVRTFDDAKALAAGPDQRDASLQEAIELFAEVQGVLGRSNAIALLSNSEVRERLTKVLQLAPNHASAKLLLLRGANRHSKRLTLSGSLDEMLHAYVYLERGKSPKYDSLQTAVSSLGKARSAFDARSLQWLDSITQYNSTKRRQSLNLSSSQQAELRKQITLALNRVELEYQKLMSNPEARESLMR